LPPVKQEVAATAAAGRAHVVERELPDPLGWGDLDHRADLVFGVVRGRIAEGRTLRNAEPFPLPKPGSDDLRTLAQLDAYDEISLRVLVGRVVPAVEQIVNRQVVFSARTQGSGGGWSLVGHRSQHRARRQRGLDLLAQPTVEGLVVLDVAQYFPSVRLDVLAGMLVQATAPEGSVAAIMTSLRRLARSGLVGLPVGFEGSSVLGNAYLAPCDQVLRGAGLEAVRWVDDTWVFPGRRTDPNRVMSLYGEALSRLGLALNTRKSAVYDKDAAEFVIKDAYLDSITSGGGERLDEDEALAVIEAGLDRPGEPSWAWVRFGLGALRTSGSTAGVRVLQDHPEIFSTEPKVSGDYLCAIAGQRRNGIDRDWLLEQAVEGAARADLARRVHACRVAGRLQLNKASGARLKESVTDETLPGPLRAWSAAAWSKCQGSKPAAAVELASDVSSDLLVRRSLCLGLCRARDNGRAPIWRDQLTRVDPDLGPTVAWALEPQ
jgi:hypothetical protein